MPFFYVGRKKKQELLEGGATGNGRAANPTAIEI